MSWQVFRHIYERLLSSNTASLEQFHRPAALPTDADMAIVHDPAYLAAFSNASLDDAQARCAPASLYLLLHYVLWKMTHKHDTPPTPRDPCICIQSSKRKTPLSSLFSVLFS